MVPLDVVPLASETKAALVAWSAKLWAQLEEEERWLESGKDATAFVPADAQAHHAEGLRLWRQVRDELGPGYDVGYAVDDNVESDHVVGPKQILWDPDA